MAHNFGQVYGNDKYFWSSNEMFATCLLVMYLDRFGPDALYWDAATIQLEVEQEYGIEIPGVNYNKLLVAINLLTTNSFFVSLPDFAHHCAILAGHMPTYDLMILPDCMDLAWGLTEGVLISPPDDDNEEPFAKEIVGYIEHALDSEGILTPPDVLRLATRDPELVSRVSYEYSDDPEMFQSIYQMEGDKTEDINKSIRGRIYSLITQLMHLQLRDKKAQENLERVAQKMLASLPRHDQIEPVTI